MRASDSSSPPVSVTQSFTVVVREVNRAPVLAAVARQTNVVGRTLTIQLSATDEDVPVNALSYSLELGAPTGASIDSVTGVFTWTPGPTSAMSTNSITVRVMDNGSPALSDTKSFVVVVTPPGELKLSPSVSRQASFN
ncbi:MAG: cadherin repeat domain-containing protein [Verrucomicrobia bacterium]|nr:cadherin repeat domain-containing protein [Verrucomicrobiota bacterium]